MPQSNFIRPVHGSGEALADELVDLDRHMERIWSEHGEPDHAHMPVSVQIMMRKFADMLQDHSHQAIVEKDIEALQMLPSLFLSIAFQAGYQAAEDGKTFEPCFCHISGEQAEHYDKVISEYMQKNYPDYTDPDA